MDSGIPLRSSRNDGVAHRPQPPPGVFASSLWSASSLRGRRGAPGHHSAVVQSAIRSPGAPRAARSVIRWESRRGEPRLTPFSGMPGRSAGPLHLWPPGLCRPAKRNGRAMTPTANADPPGTKTPVSPPQAPPPSRMAGRYRACLPRREEDERKRTEKEPIVKDYFHKPFADKLTGACRALRHARA